MKGKVIALLLVITITLASVSKDVRFVSAAPANDPAYPTYDYSNHTDPNEAWYTTNLNDLTNLEKGTPLFVRKESTIDPYWNKFQGFENKNDTFGYDVRSCDISGEDLNVVKNVNDLTFDTDTIWPKKLPKGFNPKKILEFNKNPGLGIQALHKKGITGKGVSIAIIDQGLLLDHEQYKNNIMFYERIHCSDEVASMHGPAVSSIAVGKDIGVAPGANLYYIASTFGHFSETGYEFDASIMADTILRILEINEKLDKADKIRAISISKGYGSRDKGYNELQAAIKKADEANVFVITTSTEEYYKDFALFGMDRNYDKNPEKLASYEPVSWISNDIFNYPDYYSKQLLFPIGSRTIAGFTGPKNYAIARNGGLSWAVPWCTGLYALCCQVKPDITPKEFIELANSTAITTKIKHDGKTYSYGKAINPKGIIDELSK